MFAFETLKVWQESVSFVSEIYCISKEFPEVEKFP